MEKNNIQLDRLVEAFPKLYYFIPPIQPHVIEIKGEKFRIAEPMDAILWIIETLSKDKPSQYCPLREVQGLVRAWCPPSSFSRALSHLLNANCVLQTIDEKDRRRLRVKLSPEGQEILDKVKAERADFLLNVLDKISPNNREQLVSAVEHIATLTWEDMQDRIDSEF